METLCCCMPFSNISSYVNPGCPGPESSVPVSYLLVYHISSYVTDHWGEPCNRRGEVHPVDPFYSMNNFASIAICRNSVVCNVRNGAVIEVSFFVSISGFPRH